MRADHPERAEGESKGRPAARPIRDFVRHVRRDLRRPADLTSVSEAWAQAAGPDLARSTRVQGYRGGTLTVVAENSALRSEIEAYRKPELLRRLGATLPMPVTRLQINLR